jgi:hypothetical protein
MSLGDIFKFEGFNLKDMAKKIAKHPQQLLLGVDPLSTGIQNKAFGTDYEPVVDQMGGAYGGHALSAFGNKDGGVYQRASDAGIDTKSGGQAQDAAHVIAAIIAGNYLMGKAPGQQNGNYPRPSISGSANQQQSQPIDPSNPAVQSQQPVTPIVSPNPPAFIPPPKRGLMIVSPPNGLLGLGATYGKY